MYIRNIYETPLEPLVAHEGSGALQIARVFLGKELEAPWHFIEYLEVPPGVTIGEHQHGNDEEIYFIMSGQAKMTVNGQEHDVKPGDFILNRAGWTHGLRNEGDETVKLLVIEVGIGEG